jgi:hypothetical protein
MKKLQFELTMYLKSREFLLEWKHFKYIRSDVKWLMICGSFAYNNACTKLIAETMYDAILSRLSIFRRLNVNVIPFEFIVDCALASVHSIAYNRLLVIYKKLWHNAEYIQIRWRRTMSDPAYKLCRTRLSTEFKKLVPPRRKSIFGCIINDEHILPILGP